MQKAYEDWYANNDQPEGFPSPEELLQGASGALGQTIGGPIGGAIGARLFSPEGTVTGKDAFASILPFGAKGSLDFGTDQFFNPATGAVVDAGVAGARQGANILMKEGVTPTEIIGDRTQLGIAGGQAVGNFAVQLIAGEDPASAARKAGASALASHVAKSIFTPLLGPIGGGIAGFIGGALGGRVICNELMKQGLLSKEDVILDYRFTRDYLTPQHVNGYHLWAVWVVKQMRKGRMVSFWKYIAQSRANEIAYIYGKKDKPDYVGKAIRIIGEPVCWFLGLFCKKTDWSTLYKEKET
jgi:hypothetical protein